MNKTSAFLTNVWIAALSRIWLILISVVLMIVGAIWFKICLYIGLCLLVLTVLGILIHAFSMQIMMSHVSEDDPDFNVMMEKLSADPQAFLSEVMEKKEANRNLRGRELPPLQELVVAYIKNHIEEFS